MLYYFLFVCCSLCLVLSFFLFLSIFNDARYVWGYLGHRFDITEPLGFVQDA